MHYGSCAWCSAWLVTACSPRFSRLQPALELALLLQTVLEGLEHDRNVGRPCVVALQFESATLDRKKPLDVLEHCTVDATAGFWWPCGSQLGEVTMMPTRQTLPALGPRPPEISTLYTSMAFWMSAMKSTPSGTCAPSTWPLITCISHGRSSHAYLAAMPGQKSKPLSCRKPLLLTAAAGQRMALPRSSPPRH